MAVVVERSCQDCGAGLRRTNSGTRCAACAARHAGGDVIPRAFWYAPDVAAALSQWDLPAVVRLMHQKLGLTQMAIANLTGYSQANISRWLNREGNPEGVTAQRLRQFVENLAIPWELLGLLDPAARESFGPATRESSVHPGSGTLTLSTSVGAGAEEATKHMKRRTVVNGSAVLGMGMLAPGVAALWAGDGLDGLRAGDGRALGRGKLGTPEAQQLRQLSHFLIT